MLIVYIVIAFTLFGVIKLLDNRTPSREPLLPAVRRMAAGEDRLTARMRRRFAALATVTAAAAVGSWTMFATGVGPRAWTLELTLLSSCAAIAVLIWLIAGWLGERNARRS